MPEKTSIEIVRPTKCHNFAILAAVRGEKELAVVVLGASREDCEMRYLNAWAGMDREVRLRTLVVSLYRWKYTGENCGYWWRLHPITQLTTNAAPTDHSTTRRYDA